MPTFEEIKELEDAHQLKTYAKYPVAIERGEGAYVYTTDGKKLLDFYSGHAVALTGHCHPKVVDAITEQAKKLIFFSNIVYQETRANAAAAILNLAPQFSKIFFCNSGAEANETAIKVARKHTGKTTLIAMQGGFHGRTYGAMSITGVEKYRNFPPLMPAVSFAEFGNIDSVIQKIIEANDDVAGIILEPIQSMAGVQLADRSYYKELRKICDEKGILLIFDEVQTGFGRCGANFFGDLVGVTPDIITCAKGIASGVPMGGVFLRERVASQIKLGEHGSTFGGGPIASAAALATARVITEEKLPENAKEMGALIVSSVKSLEIPYLKEIRGAALLIGLEFVTEAKKLVDAMLRRGVIIGSSDDTKTVRLLPPLIIAKQHVDEFMVALQSAVDEVFHV